MNFIPVTNATQLRIWKEFFFRFSQNEIDPSYLSDSAEQLDDRMQEEKDGNILLRQLFERS